MTPFPGPSVFAIKVMMCFSLLGVLAVLGGGVYLLVWLYRHLHWV
jgi:hypothetical protein